VLLLIALSKSLLTKIKIMKRWLLYGKTMSPTRKNVAKHFRSPHLLLLLLLNLFSFFVFAQQRVTGKVVSGNSPVVGATVTVKNTTTATQTDEGGNFSISAPANSTLVISSVGFATQEVKVGSNANVSVQLQSSDQTMESVVVVGYGTQRKATMTGSVSQVSGAEVTKSPAANLGASLQGRLPGLISNQRNGQPGRDDPTILIRGLGTLNDNSPLVVVDGVPRDQFSRLNPEDVESFSVLKDASAAIYGARAANGVILITTKSGKKGRADFSFSYNYAVSKPTKFPEVLRAPEYADVYNEGAYYRAGRNPNYWNNPQFTQAAIQKYKDGSDPVLFPNTDWVGEVVKPSSYQQNMNFQVNGGSEKVRYLISFGNLQQNGIFRADPTFYRQNNFRTKFDVELVKNFTVGANISGILKNQTYSPGNIDFFDILGANPTIVARYPNGLIGPGRLGQNPLARDQRGYDKISDNPLFSTFTASYNVPFVPGLKLDGSFNYDLRNESQKTWSTPYFFYEYNPNTQQYDKKQGTGQAAAALTDTYRKWTTMLYNLRISYDKTFLDDHHITAMVGAEQQQNTFSFASAGRKNFLSPSIAQLNVGSTAANDQSVSGSASNSAYDNYFGRINYDFQSKYLLEFLFRYDGSQVFPEDKRYGFFPGVSAGWRLSEEDFFQNAAPFVDQLKIRASYGEVGNDKIGPYQYLQTFGFGNNYVFGTADAPGLNPGVLANPDVTWERAKKTDIGLESQLWNGKLGIDFTYWIQKRNNILITQQLAIPNTFGFPGLPPVNLGKVDSRGLELILSHRSAIGKLVYNLSGNVGYQKSKVRFLDEVPTVIDYQKITGKPVNTGLYYKADGIFNTQEELDKYPHHANTKLGDLKIVDINGDGVINDKDRYRDPYNATPRYVFGLNSNFEYKNFSLNVFFQGQAGAKNYDGNAASLGGTDFTNALVWRAEDRWTEANPNGTKPRSDAWQPGNTTFFFFDATFVRLKTVELGYNIPTNIVAKTRFLKGFRVYVSGFNLATWSKEVDFADPEFNGGYFNYPPQRVINFGASIKF
jgi:TonB-linked SusC/RagA family outer membrane protein